MDHDMASPLKDFEQDFLHLLLRIHRSQWTTLGALSSVRPKRRWIIDLESLIVSTFTLGMHDREMFSAAVEWIMENREWINLSRYKRVLKIFLAADTGYGRAILSPSVFTHLPASLSRYELQIKAEDSKKTADTTGNAIDYKQFFRTFRPRGAPMEPNIKEPVSLQLLLRGVFGMDARAEVLIYFLCHESGNSNSIAKEIFYDQKAVYRIMERWKASGVLETLPGGKIGNCSLKKKSAWVKAIGFSGDVDYFNWTRLFLLCAVVKEGLSDKHVIRDEREVSYFFRGLYEDARSAAIPLDLEIPDSRFIVDAEFTEVFHSVMTGILGSLNDN